MAPIHFSVSRLFLNETPVVQTLRANVEFHRRRAFSAGAVLLLHLALLGAFLAASRTVLHLPNRLREMEFTFRETVRSPRSPSSAVLQPTLLKPAAPVVAVPPVLSLPPSAVAAPVPGAISRIGHALFGCDPAKLDLLSPEARAACRRLPPAGPHEQSVRLDPPPDPGSPFTKEIEDRSREAEPIIRPCAQGSHNDTLGLPCFGFDQKAPLLQHR